MKYNNSAGRLLALLEAARTCNDEADTVVVWAGVFSAQIEDKGRKIHQDNHAAILYRLGAMLDSLRDIQDSISVIKPTELHLYHRDFERLRFVLAPVNLEAHWAKYRSNLTDAAMMALELCAKELAIEGELPDDDLKEILAAIHDLRKMAREADDLPIPLKVWLLQMLAGIERAVELYGVRGGRKIKEALASIAGEMFSNPDRRNEIQKCEPLAQRLVRIVDLLLSAALKAKQIETLLEYSGNAGDLIGLTITKLSP